MEFTQGHYEMLFFSCAFGSLCLCKDAVLFLGPKGNTDYSYFCISWIFRLVLFGAIPANLCDSSSALLSTLPGTPSEPVAAGLCPHGHLLFMGTPLCGIACCLPGRQSMPVWLENVLIHSLYKPRLLPTLPWMLPLGRLVTVAYRMYLCVTKMGHVLTSGHIFIGFEVHCWQWTWPLVQMN